MDNLYELLLESCTIHAHSVGFPELVLPAVVQVRRLHLHDFDVGHMYIRMYMYIYIDIYLYCTIM